MLFVLSQNILSVFSFDALQVEVYDTFFNPKQEAYVISLRVEYKLGQSRTRREVKGLHESARAHAAKNFNLTLRL